MLVPDLLRHQAARSPERPALVQDGGGTLTYGAWEAASNRLARRLTAQGINLGHRVGLLFTNADALGFAVSWLAIHKAGAVAVPLGPRLTDPELRTLAGHAELTAVLAERPFAPRAAALAPRVLAEGLLEGPEDPSAYQVPRTGEDLADILYTSGTTGLPKGVACTHDNVTFKGASKMEAAFDGATFLHAVPLHTFAGTHAMTLIPLRSGMTNVVMPRFDADRFLELLDLHEVNVAYAVPSMIALVLESPRLARGRFESLRLLMYGTAPMPAIAARRLADAFPTTFLLNLYGLTEGGAAVCMLPPDQATLRPGSLGKPLPPTEVRIVDDGGAPVPPGEGGEICLRTDVTPRHYYRDPEATKRTWQDDGFLRTGDIGRVDSDGYLYLVDRKKDLVIRGGHNVSAPEVEAALLEHPDVREAAVVGVPHPVLGEDTHACIVAAVGTRPRPQDLEAFLRERLADYKVPRAYTFHSALPKNDIGKVLKRELRAAVTAGTREEAHP